MPFSQDQFFEVFAQYNQAIWPLPILAYVAGLAVLGLLFTGSRGATIIISVILAAMWAVNGVGYHWLFFARVNPVAQGFATLFVLQAILLSVAIRFWPEMRIRARRDARSITGLAMIGFAMIVYPIWGHFAGHAYPAAPVFGLAPCPTTIFTIGVLLMGDWAAVRRLLIVPALWAAIGGSAAFLLGVPQDLGLIASFLILLVFVIGHWRGQGFARHIGPA